MAETAQDYLNLRNIQTQIGITQQSIDIARHSVKLTELRFAQGTATKLDVAYSRGQMHGFEARLPVLKSQEVHLVNALSFLTAREPGALKEAWIETDDPARSRYYSGWFALRTGRTPSGCTGCRRSSPCRNSQHRCGSCRLFPARDALGQPRYSGVAVQRTGFMGIPAIRVWPDHDAAAVRRWASNRAASSAPGAAERSGDCVTAYASESLGRGR